METAIRLLIGGLQPLIDQALTLDPETRERLQTLAAEGAGAVGVEVLGTGLVCYMRPSGTGLTLHDRLGEEEEPVGWVRGAPLAMARAALTPSGRQVPGIEVSGATAEVNRLWGLLKDLDIDWEEPLARALGDPPAHALGLRLRAAREGLAATGGRMTSGLGEYLTEEARLLPGRPEMDDFLAEVDRLREDADRLAARVRRLSEPRNREP